MNRNKRSNRDFSAARGYQFHYVAACLRQNKEFCMSPRQMRIYWEEPKMDVSPAGCYSRLLKHRQPCWSHMLARRKVTHIGILTAPTLEQSLSRVTLLLDSTYLEKCVSICDGTLYLRYDTDDNTAKENESTYYDIQEDLRKIGYTITNPCIEHDCISGDIVKLFLIN